LRRRLVDHQHLAAMFALTLSLLLVALSPIVRGQGAAPTIDVGYAKIAGFQNTTSGLNQYHGIRYAQNPTGPLRWRKPRPIEAVSTDPNTVINATQIGPSCHNGVPDWNFPASVIPAGTTSSSEDCLLVDIFTPVNPISPHLPVLLEIHGGGYTQGSAQSPRPDSLLYRANGTLVWASVQYRLGMFGFLAGQDIKENGDLNAGLLDQRAGIEWVQRHIAAFGGDPDKITITGGSAGGGISLPPRNFLTSRISLVARHSERWCG
jgi:carboxylesterase type B